MKLSGTYDVLLASGLYNNQIDQTHPNQPPGVAALSLALALGNVPGRETFIVSSNSSIADQAAALAHYAEHTL